MNIGLQARIEKILVSIRNEGFTGYVKRLYDYGEWRRQCVSFMLAPFLRSRARVHIHGRELSLSKRWPGLTEELVLSGVHEPCASKIYLTKLRAGQTVIDIGSNIGYYVALADTVLQGTGEIHAFEPDPELVDILRSNCQRLTTKTTVNEAAVSSTSGQISFYRSSVSNWGAIVANEKLAQKEEIKVSSVTVDEYCAARSIEPDVIRMDVEGAEVETLRGARSSLARQPLLFMELHIAFLSRDDLEGVCTILRGSGYRWVTWVERYYDSPWSSKKAKRNAVKQGPFELFYETAASRRYPVLGVFCEGTQPTVAPAC